MVCIVENERNTKNGKLLQKKNSISTILLKFRNFWNFGNFWDLKWQFWLNGHKYCQFFFVIFDEDDGLYILVEFESDRISPRESAKNGRIGAHGLNCIFFVNFGLIFEILDKYYQSPVMGYII